MGTERVPRRTLTFRQAVWKQLAALPYGTTTSYAAIAQQLGKPTAQRAVARANGDNRLAIIIPCHRVIGRDGKLAGYGGGVWRKQRLIELEQFALERQTLASQPQA